MDFFDPFSRHYMFRLFQPSGSPCEPKFREDACYCSSQEAYMPNTPNYSTTVLLCSVLALLTMPVHAGFMLIFLAPVFAIWVPYSFVLMWRSPASRRIQMNKLMIWTVVICSIVSLHWFYAYSAPYNNVERTAALNILTFVARLQMNSSKEL